MDNRGKFIVIEGADGIGKTSLINNLKKSNILKEIFDSITFYNDPSSELYVASKIRNIIKEDTDKMTKETNLFLYLAARAELNESIKSIIDDNPSSAVICDRYNLSTYVYQASRINKSIINTIEELLDLNLKPDLIILLTKDKPYREEINDTVEKVYNFEMVKSGYEEILKDSDITYFNNIVELHITDDMTEQDVFKKAIQIIIKNI